MSENTKSSEKNIQVVGYQKFEDEDDTKQQSAKKSGQKQRKNSLINSLVNKDDYTIYHIPDLNADRNKAIKSLICVSLICIVFMITEVVGGFLANSLAIMTDAAHLFSDVSGFFISIFSIWISSLPSDKKMTYGYSRSEIIGALTSIIFIWGLTIWLLYEASLRIINPPSLNPEIMLVVSCLGLIFNLVMFKVLHESHGHSHGGHECGHSHGPKKEEIKDEENHKHEHNHEHKDGHKHDHDHEHKDEHKHDHDHSHDHSHNHDHSGDSHDHGHSHGGDENINVRAAMIHIIGDTIQSIGVILAALLIYFGGDKYEIADPICTFLFSILVFFTTIPLFKESMRVLMEGVPTGINIQKLEQDLKTVEGLKTMHDLHVWSLNGKSSALSCHMVSIKPTQTLREATKICKKHKIYHSTIQVEDASQKATYDHDLCETELVKNC